MSDAAKIPNDILVYCIAKYLPKHEQYTFYSLCKPHLLQVRTFTFTEEYYLLRFAIDDNYKKMVLNLVGCTNKKPERKFKSFS